MEKKLALVKSVCLNLKDRGILTLWIELSYEDGFFQNMGGMALDTINRSRMKREGTSYGCEIIRSTLDFFDVDDFSQTKDRIVYVSGEGEGLNFIPSRLDHLSVFNNKKYLDFNEIRGRLLTS